MPHDYLNDSIFSFQSLWQVLKPHRKLMFQPEICDTVIWSDMHTLRKNDYL